MSVFSPYVLSPFGLPLPPTCLVLTVSEARSYFAHTILAPDHLGGVVVTVLATGPKSRGFKPGRGDGFLRAIKIPQRNFLRMGSKAERSHVARFYAMLKIRWRISDTDMQNSHSFVQSSYSLPDVSACKTARELWWTTQEFSPGGIITTMAVHAHISPGGWTIGPLVAAVLGQASPHHDQSINQLAPEYARLPDITSLSIVNLVNRKQCVSHVELMVYTKVCQNSKNAIFPWNVHMCTYGCVHE
jgi:hypothetical protein